MRFVRGRVLDIGCGAGRVALHLQGRGHEVVGIDISPGAVRSSKGRGVKIVRQMSLETLDDRIGRFDTVIMFGNNFGLGRNAAAPPSASAEDLPRHEQPGPDPRRPWRPLPDRRSRSPCLPAAYQGSRPDARSASAPTPLPQVFHAVVRVAVPFLGRDGSTSRGHRLENRPSAQRRRVVCRDPREAQNER